MKPNARISGTWSDALVGKLSNKAYRIAYVREHVKTWITYQIRALREQRGWLQGKLAREMDKPQSVVSRIEDPDYGKLTLQTLFEVAAAFDVALIVKFVDYRSFLGQTRNVGRDEMQVASFNATALKPFERRHSSISFLIGDLFDRHLTAENQASKKMAAPAAEGKFTRSYQGVISLPTELLETKATNIARGSVPPPLMVVPPPTNQIVKEYSLG
jgi:transcriptional regulator with XRE-family HTH domain